MGYPYPYVLLMCFFGAPANVPIGSIVVPFGDYLIGF